MLHFEPIKFTLCRKKDIPDHEAHSLGNTRFKEAFGNNNNMATVVGKKEIGSWKASPVAKANKHFVRSLAANFQVAYSPKG